MSGYKPKIERVFLTRTAEALALPQMVCGRRVCRRAGACCFHFTDTGEPCCLQNLSPEQRRIFDEVCEKAHRVREFLGMIGLTYAAPMHDLRALEDIAVEIARATFRRGEGKNWHAARRAREKLPPSRWDDYEFWYARKLEG